MFVIRNAGNTVPAYGGEPGGVSATVEYAVAILHVTDIVIFGHSDCGAMTAIATVMIFQIWYFDAAYSEVIHPAAQYWIDQLYHPIPTGLRLKRWSRRWLYDELKLFNGYRVRRTFQRVLQLHQRLGGKEDPTPHGSISESPPAATGIAGTSL